MSELRIHTVMGKVAISLWCNSHGKGASHCIWSGQRWRTGLEPGDIMLMLTEAANEMWRVYERGELDELTDDCL